jgi:hypothetical protein
MNESAARASCPPPNMPVFRGAESTSSTRSWGARAYLFFAYLLRCLRQWLGRLRQPIHRLLAISWLWKRLFGCTKVPKGHSTHDAPVTSVSAPERTTICASSAVSGSAPCDQSASSIIPESALSTQNLDVSPDIFSTMLVSGQPDSASPNQVLSSKPTVCDSVSPILNVFIHIPVDI